MATHIPEAGAPEAPRAADPTIGRLVNDALVDVSTLFRSEIALAKAEVTSDAKKAGKAIAMFVAAGFFGVLGLVFLLHTAAMGLIAAGLAPWLSYLIVTLVLFLIAGILALVGKGALKGFQGKPKSAIANAQQTVDKVKLAATGERTATLRAQDPHAHGATGGASGASTTVTAATTGTAAVRADDPRS